MRYTVVTTDKVTETQALALGTSAQRAELIALTRALELSQGRNVNIYTDSKSAFVVVHARGAIWKQRGLLTKGNTDIKHEPRGIRISNTQNITLKLLEVVSLPNQAPGMHCPGHQKASSQTSQGNQTDGKAASQAAKGYHFLGFNSPP